jgi:tetratricopeptide (TPR) repeat protein
MKAEHRKELQTNVLADRVGRLLQGIKSRPSPTAITIGILFGLAILIGIGWWVYRQYSHEKQSNAWVQIDEADSVRQLQDIADEKKGGMPNRIVRFDLARAKLRHGLMYYYAVAERDDALTEIEEAAELYAALADESKDIPILVQEALLGMGKARESLDDLDSAREAYQKLVDRYKDSAAGEEAAKRLKALDDSQAVKLSTELKELGGKKGASQ